MKNEHITQPIVINRKDVKPSVINEGDVRREVIVLQESKNLITGITTILPRSRTKGHAHPEREEHYYVLTGKGHILLDNERYEIQTGDCIYVPPVSVHTLVNPNDESLEFFWVAFPDEPKI
jgi:quercetin dioxygenase-like cupin family protein